MFSYGFHILCIQAYHTMMRPWETAFCNFYYPKTPIKQDK